MAVVKMSKDASSRLQYLGEAEGASLTSGSNWRITKFTYDNGFMTDIKHPNGNGNFVYSWDDRASYSYS